MDFNRMRVTTKLWIFIGLILALIVSVAGIGLNRSAGIIAKGNAAQDVALETARIAAQWNAFTEVNSVRNHAIILSSGTVVTDAFKDAVKATSEQISELQKKLEAMPLQDVDKTQLQKVGDLRKQVISLREKARALKLEDKQDEALQVFNTQYMPAVQAYIVAQREFVKMQDTRVQEIQVATEQKRQENARFILMGLAVVLVLIFAGTAWLVGSIRDPLAQANALAARIARGDLSTQVRVNRGDEFGELLRSFATMNESLALMVAEIRSGTDQIATASAEISSGNNDLAHRTEQTSSNLQSTASSMDSLTQTVQHSAGSARQASTLASSASEVAQRGGTMVMQVVSTMQDIDSSSKKIADIISVIDGIAFQTNILALNAAVEAARAGEQGRGFAVVASEVRSLAGRSAEAAREIKVLINDSVERVESGTRLVSDAGATMQEIVQSVRRVADVIGEITADVTEQSSGIAGVNQAISNLDQMTQQNAALVEESAAAAESLRYQADRMKQAVAVFTV